MCGFLETLFRSVNRIGLGRERRSLKRRRWTFDAELSRLDERYFSHCKMHRPPLLLLLLLLLLGRLHAICRNMITVPILECVYVNISFHSIPSYIDVIGLSSWNIVIFEETPCDADGHRTTLVVMQRRLCLGSRATTKTGHGELRQHQLCQHS